MLTPGVLSVVLAAGAPREACVADRVLSLLRERFEDAGETGIELGADMTPVTAGSVLRRPPLSFALRLSARSLCSVKEGVSVSRRTCGPGSWGATRLGGMNDSGGRQAADRLKAVACSDSSAGSSMRAEAVA